MAVAMSKTAGAAWKKNGSMNDKATLGAANKKITASTSKLQPNTKTKPNVFIEEPSPVSGALDTDLSEGKQVSNTV